jgi:hypothetical protein
MKANRDAPCSPIALQARSGRFVLHPMPMAGESRHSVKLRINQIAMAICGVTSQTGN